LFSSLPTATMPTLVVETVDPAEEENYQASLVLATVEAVIGPCTSLSSAAAVLVDEVAALKVCSDDAFEWTMVENAATAHHSKAAILSDDVPFDEDPMVVTGPALVRIEHCPWTIISRYCVSWYQRNDRPLTFLDVSCFWSQLTDGTTSATTGVSHDGRLPLVTVNANNKHSLTCLCCGNKRAKIVVLSHDDKMD
jgi:hypothetical protein